MRNILFLFSFILLFVSCKNDPADVEINTISTENTVFVYMAADNNLSSFVLENIKGMKDGLKNNNVEGNLVIYLDKQGSTPKLILLVKNDQGEVSEKIIKTYPEQNSVYPTVMSNVINDMVQSFPSKNYNLILWSHGNGWIPGAKNVKSVLSRWFGDDENNNMDIPDLVRALKEGPHFNFILFDACFMAGVETSYALRSRTDYLIASPAEILSDGFPYEKIFPSLFGKTESDYVAIASTFYNHYNQLSGTSRSATITCLKTAELDQLAVETNKLYSKHITELNAIKVNNDIQPLECYKTHLYYDFGHLVERISTVSERVDFDAQMKKVIVYKNHTPTVTSVESSGHWEQVPINKYSGLNCFIPNPLTPSYNMSYRANEWYNATALNFTNW